jgi:dTDP-4-dehydrorhamnose reductase
MKVLVTGGKGQLGSELHKISTNYNFEWLFTDRNSFDLSNLDNIDVYLDICKPNIIINCAAYTSVNCAEVDFETANIINHKSVKLIAKWCDKANCKLIHISTDYVYQGNSVTPYNEKSLTKPLNNYGKTKLLGDLACQKNNPSSIILRTSWLYSSFGDNFLKKMINLMQDSDEIEVVDDQIGSPTYAADLANVLLAIINNNDWKDGVYNYANEGKTSWFDLANDIKMLCGFNVIINPVTSKHYAQKAKRPKYSALDITKITKTFDINPTKYKDSLKNCIKILINET